MALTSLNRVTIFSELLEKGPEVYERVAQRWRRAEPVARCLVTLAWLGIFGLAAWQLGRAGATGRGGDWQDFWNTNKSVWSVLPLTSIGVVIAEISRAFTRAIEIRQSALAGDERLATRAAVQPQALPLADLPLGVVEFESLADAKGQLAHRRLMAASVLGVSGIVAGGLALLIADSFLRHLSSDPGMDAALLLTLVLISVSMLVFAPWALWQEWRIAGGVRFAADEWGLRRTWSRRQPDESRIAWHEARAFYMVQSARRRGGIGPAIYALDSGDRIFTWALPRRASQAQAAAHEHLARLIATHAGLPLRDLSGAVDMLEFIPDGGNEVERPPSPEQAIQFAAAGASATSAPQGGRVRGWRDWTLGCGPFLLTFMLPVAGWVIEHFQGH
jgi:hypothetical protein